MGTRERRSDRGREQAARINVTTGVEVRLTRRSGGTSIRTAAAAVDMSESTFGRIERGRLPNVTVEQLALACASVGLKFVARAYPDGAPVRDVAHTRLLRRFRDQSPAEIVWRTEVPIPILGDLRAWDLQAKVGTETIGIEAETRLSDVQALDRRIALKVRDSPVTLVLLVLADTTANRRALAESREALRPAFPLDTRAVLGALRSGGPPSASGIVVL
jgi:transcriptional regulator with XRE-family HTH domain